MAGRRARPLQFGLAAQTRADHAGHVARPAARQSDELIPHLPRVFVIETAFNRPRSRARNISTAVSHGLDEIEPGRCPQAFSTSARCSALSTNRYPGS